jgi:hypothetical protein
MNEPMESKPVPRKCTPQEIREKYADMYITMQCFQDEIEAAAKLKLADKSTEDAP